MADRGEKGFSGLEQDWFREGELMDERTEELLEGCPATIEDIDGNPVFASRISAPVRASAMLVLAAFLAGACVTKQTLNTVPYGSYFKKMAPADVKNYSITPDFEYFLSMMLRLNFDRNISSKDLDKLKHEVARLKAKNPVFQCNFKATQEYGYHYDTGLSVRGSGRTWKNYDGGVSADDFQKTFEVARGSCDEALSNLEDILRDMTGYKKALSGDSSEQSDYDKYRDLLRRVGVQFENALKVFPLADAYVLADALMMMAEEGINAGDLEQAGIDLKFLREVLATQKQQIEFRQYLLGSFEDDAENGSCDLDLLAKCLASFVLETGIESDHVLTRMETIISDVKKHE